MDWVIILVILFVVAVMGITLAVKLPEAKKIRQKRLAAEKSGDLVKRSPYFYKNREFFKAHIQNFDAFCNALSAAVQRADVCSFSGNYNSRIIYQGTSSKWTATLDRLQTNDGSVMFSFGLTNYEQTQLSGTANVMALYQDMNFLLTAIERTFIQFDPSTQVTEQAINFKHNNKLF